MTLRTRSSTTDFLHGELAEAVAMAVAEGGHRDHPLLLLHVRFHEAERAWHDASEACDAARDQRDRQALRSRADALEAHRQDLLRRLIGTPARTPLGTALKLAIACDLDSLFDAAQEVPPGGLGGSHVIVSAFLDTMAQARLLEPKHPRVSH